MSGADFDKVLSPATRDALKHLELTARRVVDGVLHGQHRSRRKGVSNEFDHHTLYQPGDSLRRIDWKASARQGRIFVRRYIEDTSLSVRLVVDRSASMRSDPGGSGRPKSLVAAELAACFAYLCLRLRDSVALGLADPGGTRWLPPRSSESHLVSILTQLCLDPDGREAADPSRCLADLRERGGRRGLVILISDLQYDPSPVRKELAPLLAQGHEVILCMPGDAVENDFPFRRWMIFEDAEVAGRRHRVDAVALRRLYEEECQAHRSDWQDWARSQGVHFIALRNDASLAEAVATYLVRRQAGAAS